MLRYHARLRGARALSRSSGVVYRPLTDVRELDGDNDLAGEDVLPGFRCALRDIFS